MNKNLTLKQIKIICTLATLAVWLLFASLLLTLPADISVKITLFLLSLLLLLPSIAAVLFYQRELTSFAAAMDVSLSHMLRGEPLKSLDSEQDTLLGKLQVQLHRLYEIQKQHSSKSQEEKLLMQSLVSDISHQVKTPLANIKMYQSILQNRQVAEEDQKEFFKSIEEQVDKLDFLMSALVQMSRLETGLIELQPHPQPIYHTIAHALSGIYPKAEKKKLNVRIECSEKLFVKHDEKWTAEAFFNLLDNAVKYTETFGTLTINVSAWEFYAKIDITNSGKGISEERLGKIFERFYREPEVQSKEGIGIGLYLAREIISRQHGFIKVNSLPGTGSTFSIFLPRA